MSKSHAVRAKGHPRQNDPSLQGTLHFQILSFRDKDKLAFEIFSESFTLINLDFFKKRT